MTASSGGLSVLLLFNLSGFFLRLAELGDINLHIPLNDLLNRLRETTKGLGMGGIGLVLATEL